MYKLIGSFFGVILSYITFSVLAEQCSDISIYDRSGRFMVLDHETLATKDIGDLRGYGILMVNEPLNGSDVNWPIISVERLVNLTTGKTDFDTGYYLLPPFDLRRYAFDRPQHIVTEGDFQLAKVNNVPTVVIIRQNLNGSTSYEFKPLDGQKARKITVNKRPQTTNQAFCQNEGSIYYMGKSQLFKFGENDYETFDLPFNGVNLVLAADNCQFLLKTTPTHQQSKSSYVIYDALTQRLTRNFIREPDSDYFMFDNGRQLAIQRVEFEPDASIANAYYKIPQPHFEWFDTMTGKTKKSVQLEKDYGAAQKLICKDSSPTLVLTQKNYVHLLDVRTLTIKQSKHVLFERFFIF